MSLTISVSSVLHACELCVPQVAVIIYHNVMIKDRENPTNMSQSLEKVILFWLDKMSRLQISDRLIWNSGRHFSV